MEHRGGRGHRRLPGVTMPKTCGTLLCRVASTRGTDWRARVIIIILYVDLALGVLERMVQ
jgi:hypothetical protein